MELEKNASVSMTKARRMIGRIAVSKTECLDVGLPRCQLARVDQNVDVCHGPRCGIRIERASKGCTFEQTQRTAGANGCGSERFHVVQSNHRSRELDVETFFETDRDEAGCFDRRSFQPFVEKRTQAVIPGTCQHELPVDGSASLRGLGTRHQVTDERELCWAQLAQRNASFRGHSVRYARTSLG